MNASKKLGAGIMLAFLASAPYAMASSSAPNGQWLDKQNNGPYAMMRPCTPLSWEAASKLPSFIDPREVICMSPTVDDLSASEDARALLVKTTRDMQNYNVSPASPAGTEYENGLNAYAEGRYLDAISHFRASTPSLKRVRFDQ